MPPTGAASSAGFMLGMNTNVPQQLQAMGVQYQKMVDSVIRLNKRLTRSFAQTATTMTSGAAAFTGGPAGPGTGSNSRPRYGASSPYLSGAMGMRGRGQADAMAQIFGTIAASAQRAVTGARPSNAAESNRLSKAFNSRNPWTFGLTGGRGNKVFRQITKSMQSIESGKTTAAQGADTVSGLLTTLLNVPSKNVKTVRDEITKGLIPALDKLTKTSKTAAKAVGGGAGSGGVAGGGGGGGGGDGESLAGAFKKFQKSVGYSLLSQAIPALTARLVDGINQNAFSAIQGRLGKQSAIFAFDEQVGLTGATETRYATPDMQAVVAGAAMYGRGLSPSQLSSVSPEVAATAASAKVFGIGIEDLVGQIEPLIKKYRLNSRALDKTTQELVLMGRASGMAGSTLASIVSNIGSITRSRGLFGDKATGAAKQAAAMQAAFDSAGIDVDATQIFGALTDPMGGLATAASMSSFMRLGDVHMSISDIDNAINSGNFGSVGEGLIASIQNFGKKYKLSEHEGRQTFSAHVSSLLAGTGISGREALSIAMSPELKNRANNVMEAGGADYFGAVSRDMSGKTALGNAAANFANNAVPGGGSFLAEGGVALLTQVVGIGSDVLKLVAGIAAFLGVGAVAGAAGAAGGALGAAGVGAAAGLAGVLAAGIVTGLSVWWATGQVQKFIKGDFDNASIKLPFGLNAVYDHLALRGIVPPALTGQVIPPDKNAAGKRQQYLRNQENRAQASLNLVDPSLGITQNDLREAGQFVRLRADPGEETNQLLRLIYQAMSTRPPLMPHIAG